MARTETVHYCEGFRNHNRRTPCKNKVDVGVRLCRQCIDRAEHAVAEDFVKAWQVVALQRFEVTGDHVALLGSICWDRYGIADESGPRANWEFPWGGREYDLLGAAEVMGWPCDRDEHPDDVIDYVQECAGWLVMETHIALGILTENIARGLQPGVYVRTEGSRVWERATDNADTARGEK